MRLRFDQLGKQIGREALTRSGHTVANDEISPDAQYADLRHEPDPARDAQRAQLGLLGRLAASVCLIELYSQAPDEDDVLACIGKLIAFRAKQLRAFRKKQARKPRSPRSDTAFVEPGLWIITAGRPDAVLAAAAAKPAPGWPPGVYRVPLLLPVRVIVASELPRDRDTLLVRLMAAGSLLPAAVQDLSRLPRGALEHAMADQILLNLRHVLEKRPNSTPEEQEFIMRMFKTWDDVRQEARALGLREGHLEGLHKGRTEEAARALFTVLRARGLAVSEAARERILAARDTELLERWLERAVVMSSVAEIIEEPS